MAQSEPVTDDIEAPTPVEIWSQYPGLSESKLFEEYLNRLVAGRDMHVLITAASETGVGKTTLAFAIAVLWDLHGWTVEKATLDPREYSAKYDEVDPGSVLILDEAEQALDARRSMSSENVDVGHDFATKRYRQVFGILTLPSKGWLDNRIGDDVIDYWIQCQETDRGKPKGEAKVYRQRSEEHYETSYTKKTETLSWPVLDWHSEFRKLEDLKRQRMEGKVESKYVPRSEVEDIKQNYWDKATEEKENELIESMYEFGLNQSDIGDIVGVHQTTISRRLEELGVK